MACNDLVFNEMHVLTRLPDPRHAPRNGPRMPTKPSRQPSHSDTVETSVTLLTRVSWILVGIAALGLLLMVASARGG